MLCIPRVLAYRLLANVSKFFCSPGSSTSACTNALRPSRRTSRRFRAAERALARRESSISVWLLRSFRRWVWYHWLACHQTGNNTSRVAMAPRAAPPTGSCSSASMDRSMEVNFFIRLPRISNLRLAALHNLDDPLVQGAKGRVDRLPGGIGVVPGENLFRPLPERDSRSELGHQPADFAVVEDHAVHFIPHQACSPIWVVVGDQFGRRVDQPGFHPGGLGDEFIDLVPGQPLIGSDVESLADSVRVAEQSHQPRRKIAVVRQGPERGAVAVHHNLFTCPHARYGRVAVAEGQQRLVVGVRGSHDDSRESFSQVSLHEGCFALSLQARVLPEGIAQRRA